MENSVKQQLEQLLSEISWWYDKEQELRPLLVYQKELQELIRLGDSEVMQNRVTAILGRKGCGRKLLLMTAARALGKSLLLADGNAFLKLYVQCGGQILFFLAQKVTNNACLLCFSDCEVPNDLEAEWKIMLQSLMEQGIDLWLTMECPQPLPENMEYAYTEIGLQEPDISVRAEVWRYFLEEAGEEESLDVEKLGACYNFHCGEIRQVLNTAVLGRIREGRKKLCEDDIRKAAGIWGRGSLGTLAVKIPCVFTWEDLVVDAALEGKLREFCNLVVYQSVVGNRWGFFEKRPYGNGMCVLFYGPSGTGKTMAAQVVARELGMELYRVDLSQMNSKYIGETQKNLHTLFENAQGMNIILFFDEADAFFSRRTSVKDANDRHANGEIAYLLQRLEQHQGITILATNLKNQFDDAFRRRIRRMIHFQLPDCDTRRRMWEKAFPRRAPLSQEVDFSRYAMRFELSAGEIKEAAMDAAFLAAAEGTEISDRHIREALKICYEKYGRVLTELDF